MTDELKIKARVFLTGRMDVRVGVVDVMQAFGVLDWRRIVVVDVLHRREIGRRDLRHVVDDVRAVVVRRNPIVGAMQFEVRLVRVYRVDALATHRGHGGGTTQQLIYRVT